MVSEWVGDWSRTWGTYKHIMKIEEVKTEGVNLTKPLRNTSFPTFFFFLYFLRNPEVIHLYLGTSMGSLKTHIQKNTHADRNI